MKTIIRDRLTSSHIDKLAKYRYVVAKIESEKQNSEPRSEGANPTCEHNKAARYRTIGVRVASSIIIWIHSSHTMPPLGFVRLLVGILLLLASHGNCLTPTSAATTRSLFLSSSAASFLASGIFIATAEPDACLAEQGGSSTNSNGSPNPNPRYIERELEMKYGVGPDGNPRTRGVLVRRFTGDSTPYQFPVKPVRLVKEWPEQPPFTPEDFFRTDQNNDGWFYKVPRLVYHIDEPAVAALTQYYRNNIRPGSAILDICSSWTSHYPLEFPKTMRRISASGISALELQFNDQLTDYKAKDLNDDPTLPYDDNTFDVVTCVVSIDYLIHPIEVLKEVRRVLRPGGKMIISQSNRCFPSKAINMWLQMNDRQHLELINGYFQYAGGFLERQAFDITATVPNNEIHDPMFIVEATKA